MTREVLSFMPVWVILIGLLTVGAMSIANITNSPVVKFLLGIGLAVSTGKVTISYADYYVWWYKKKQQQNQEK